MLGSSHVVVGFAAALATSHLFHVPLSPVVLAAALAGSLAPDIDGGGSISRPSKFFGGALPRFAGRIVDSIGAGSSAAVRALVGHRGVLHWPLTGIIIFMTGFYLRSPLTSWFAIGYLSHILADTVTVEGIPFFAPLSLRRVSLGVCRTGSFVEFLLIAALSGCILYFSNDQMTKEISKALHLRH